MRDFLKKILSTLPRPLRTIIVRVREAWWYLVMNEWERRNYPALPKLTRRVTPIKTVLVYAINGLTHGGTEKNLQLVANALVAHYEVVFMYGTKTAEKERLALLDPRITLVPFLYETNEIAVPHRLTGMRPHFKDILAQHNIDLIVTASPGYAHYPWNIVADIPIILSNVFGAPSLQRNIVATIFMSQTVRDHAEAWTGSSDKHHTMYLPLGKAPHKDTRTLGTGLRERLGIPKNDFVFGRIGRDSDAIFDPIGIRAWQRIASEYPAAHYLIMSPPPLLVKIVEEENIPRVHFLPPSGKEEDIWAFHGALDCFAHFRLDGETSGVAIAESLAIGNPIITHRSHIWNAHLEYLTDDCARIAATDDIDMYAMHMGEYIHLRRNAQNSWDARCKAAYSVGEAYFSPNHYSKNIRSIINNIKKIPTDMDEDGLPMPKYPHLN